MRNISKRTVTVLDTADVNALLHLSDEFPDVSLLFEQNFRSSRKMENTELFNLIYPLLFVSPLDLAS